MEWETLLEKQTSGPHGCSKCSGVHHTRVPQGNQACPMPKQLPQQQITAVGTLKATPYSSQLSYLQYI